MVEKCTVCGNKLEDDVKFCPDCGEKIAPAKETKKTNKEETKIKTKSKTTTKKKKNKIKFSIPKISIKNIPKPVLTGIALICIAFIAIAAVVVVSPFDLTGSVVDASDGGSRVFSILVENTDDSDAKCYLTVSGLRYNYFGTDGEFTVPAGETVEINIVEDVLFVKKSNYEISLFASIDHVEKGTASDVTESAEFLIQPIEEEGEFIIESIGVR